MDDVMWGQIVVGPPGSGKSTYCTGMQQFMNAIGRKCAVVNLDPANDGIPYDCAVDVSELVELSDVMEHCRLGPNGGLLYCAEFLEENFEWLETRVRALKGHYLLFDLPGQVELYTHNGAMPNVIHRLQKLGLRLASVHLVDAFHCTDAANFIAAALVSLSCMMRLELPHLNVLSKIDMVERFGDLEFGLDFYTDVVDLRRLVDDPDADPDEDVPTGKGDRAAGESGDGDGAPTHAHGAAEGRGEGAGESGAGAESGSGVTAAETEGHVARPALRGRAKTFFRKRRRLHQLLCDLIDDFRLVGFVPLDIQSPGSVAHVLRRLDVTNGYVLGALGEDAEGGPAEWAASATVEEDDYRLAMAEKYTRFGADDAW